jgi:Fe-S cluster assembly protein SufD
VSAVAEETDVYLSRFEELSKALTGEPAWLRSLREAAIARFAKLGFPTVRDEAWKYTSLAPITRRRFRVPQHVAADTLRGEMTRLSQGASERHRIVFVNGRFAPEASALADLPRGVEVLSLKDVLSRQPERIEPYLARLGGGGPTPFASLNTAFLDDGACVLLAPRAVCPDPVYVVWLSTDGGGEPPACHPRTLVVAGPESQVRVVESFGGPEGATYLTNAVAEIAVGDGALVGHYKLQRESEAAFHVASLAVRQGRDTRFADHAVSLGAALARNDIVATFDGEGGDCVLNGLFMAAGDQHVDTNTLIDHARPRCSSRELYKGILDGRSRGVFTGTVVVQKDAQKTDAQQTNKNLLLSPEALVNSTPQLRILADDVKCKHGSTTGQLDPTALFYLRSRGIGEATARGLLVYAFASDVVQRMRIEPIRAGLESWLQRRLPSALEIKEAVV